MKAFRPYLKKHEIGMTRVQRLVFRIVFLIIFLLCLVVAGIGIIGILVDLLDPYSRELGLIGWVVAPIFCVGIGIFGWYGGISIAIGVVWIVFGLGESESLQ